MPLPKTEHAKLRAMLGVALSSAHEGEALVALRKALALCSKHKLTLFDALGSASASELDTKRIEQVERDAYARGLAAAENNALDAAEAVVKRRLEQEYYRGYANGEKTAYTRGLRDGETHARHNLAPLPAGTGISEAQARAAQAQWAQLAQANVNVYGQGLGNQAPNQGISQPLAPQNNWRGVAQTLLKDHAVQLRPKDVDFLQSILLRNRSRLTEAQNNWLCDLAQRCGVAMSNSC